MSATAMPLPAAASPARFRRLNAWCQHLEDADRLDLATTLTLLLLLLHAPELWYVHMPIVVLAVCGLALSRVRRTAFFWLLITACLALGLVLNWYTLDNHKYLEAYWTLSLCLVATRPAGEQPAALATNARWLVAACMVFSVFWKLYSPTFREGSFFEFTLLTDPRFQYFASWVGGIPRAAVLHDQQMERVLVVGFMDGFTDNQVTLVTSPGVKWLAQALMYWTLAIEGVIAILFCLPLREKLCIVRELLLLVFAVTTYMIATVQGFGWLLLILAIAQSRHRWLVFCFFVTFLLLQVYTVPYGDVLTSWTPMKSAPPMGSP